MAEELHIELTEDNVGGHASKVHIGKCMIPVAVKVVEGDDVTLDAVIVEQNKLYIWLDSSFLVKQYGAKIVDGQIYQAMEIMERSLEDFIVNETPFECGPSKNDLLFILRDIVTVIDGVHQSGDTISNLKPSNLFVCHGRVKWDLVQSTSDLKKRWYAPRRGGWDL